MRRLLGRLTTWRRRRSAAELRALQARDEQGWPPGHFYSPIPDLDDVRRRDAAIFDRDVPPYGIDHRQDAQLALLRDMAAFYPEQPWASDRRPGLRYWFDNPNFQQGEALVLYGLLRLGRPQRVVEVGSGWSSCALLDVNERFLDGAVTCTFVEPYPELLRELTPDDDHLDVRPVPVQEADPVVFEQLEEGDMLIIDSTHVAKVGSDVNHLLFEVLPRLAPGVLVHVHDIYYPFEYPRAWVYEGRAWNEVYVVHAFLMFNSAWEIVFFNSFIGARNRPALATALPPAADNPGSSLWLRRTAADAATGAS